MIPKLTKEDHLFVIRNFNEDGWLFNVKKKDEGQIRHLVSTGYVVQKYNYIHKQMCFVACGSLMNSITSYHLSKLLNTTMVAVS